MNVTSRKTVNGVDFTILGNLEIRNISALGRDNAGITVPDLFDGLEPKRNGLIDPRMGTTSEDIICATCGLNSTYCGGHFGHITLEEYVFHIGYLPFVKKILGCVCLKCSKLLVYNNEAELQDILKNKSGKNRLAEVKNLVKDVMHCQRPGYGCGTPVSKIKLDHKKSQLTVNLVAEFKMDVASDETTKDKKIEQVLTPEDCYNILKNISDEDCIILGLDPKKSRPEDMIHKIFPVPPVPVRPSVRSDGSSVTREDDLTRKIADIVKKNEAVATRNASMGGQLVKNMSEQAQLLQYHIATYMDNETPFMPKSEQKGKQLKSITSRLKGKEGRFRSNLMGKRVDFSARTVITPDPMISINEIGVPLTIAKTLTYPEVVTEYNIEKMRQHVRNGRDIYPGANVVIPKKYGDGGRVMPIDLRFRKDKVTLRVGDIVERHLMDGDVVLLNRQPTLHKQSMMGHYVKVLLDERYDSFRVNVGVTQAYNADFDGDEMNITVPQCIQTKIELEELSDVKYVMVSPETSYLCMGLKQDGVLGAYCMTQDSVKIDGKTFMNLLTTCDLPKKVHIDKNKIYSGHELFSCILPERINKFNNGQKKDPLISFGNLISGSLRKAYLADGQSQNLIQLILDEYDANEARRFFDNAQRLVNSFLLFNGFSVGVGDTFISKELNKQVEELRTTEMLKADILITSYENDPSIMDAETFEATLQGTLNNVGNTAHSLVNNNLPVENRINIMSANGSGSKGSPSFTGQMIVFMGQQIFESGRIQKKAEKRSLAYFPRDDDRASARGFITNCFLNGLSYSEFVFHNMTAREGLIDTAIKTADTGYTQRKLIKTMEDIHVNYDGTLRSSSGSIIQFTYGDTGANTVSQYKYGIDILGMGNSDVNKRYKFTPEELSKFEHFTSSDNDKYIEWLIGFRDRIRQTQIKAHVDFKTFKEYMNFMLPIGIYRIVDQVKNMKHTGKKLTPDYVLQRLDELMGHKNTHLVCVSKNAKEDVSVKLLDEMIVKTSICLAIHNAFAPRRCIIEYGITEEEFEIAFNEIVLSYRKNLVEAGENVGILAAQSICHPLTQMTLNTFHQSGVGARGSITQGVPRMKELLSLAKNIKTPQMTIYMSKENMHNKEMANRIAAHIKQTTIGHLRDRIDIYYDPKPTEAGSFMETDHIGKPFFTHSTSASCQSDITDLPWLMRIELNREKLLLKDVTLLDILSKFCNMWETRHNDMKKLSKDEKLVLNRVVRCSVLSNSDNDDIPIIHIRFDMNEPSIEIMHKFIEVIIDTFKIKGLVGIDDIDGIDESSYVNFDNPDSALETLKEYSVVSAGTNMTDIRYLNGIDLNRTLCNDVMKVYEIFGIEAARNMLMCEITMVVNNAGSKLNYHHLSILVDLMTRDGFMISVDRHGIGRTDAALLGKVSFEKPVEQLLIASLFNESDSLKGVSARIMTGNVIRSGTGMCEILMDSDMIEKSEYVEPITDVKRDVIGETEEVLMDDIMNKTATNTFIPIDDE